MLSNLPKTTPSPVTAFHRQIAENIWAERIDLATIKDLVAAHNGVYDSVIYYAINRANHPTEFALIQNFFDHAVMPLDGTGTIQKDNPDKLEEQKETVAKETIDNTGLANLAKGLGAVLVLIILFGLWSKFGKQSK